MITIENKNLSVKSVEIVKGVAATGRLAGEIILGMSVLAVGKILSRRDKPMSLEDDNRFARRGYLSEEAYRALSQRRSI